MYSLFPKTSFSELKDVKCHNTYLIGLNKFTNIPLRYNNADEWLDNMEYVLHSILKLAWKDI